VWRGTVSDIKRPGDKALAVARKLGRAIVEESQRNTRPPITYVLPREPFVLVLCESPRRRPRGRDAISQRTLTLSVHETSRATVQLHQYRIGLPAATIRKVCEKSLLFRGRAAVTKKKWSERRDSNPRPPVPQTDALPDCATLRLRGG
jgi:hypothetical protein